MSRSRNRNNNAARRGNAQIALDFLSSIFKNNNVSNQIILDSAARSILRIGRRHGVRPEANVSRKICRKCESALIPGRTTRIRISHGFILNTCNGCDETYRYRLNSLSGE